MGEPRVDYEDNLRGAMMELNSAMSALNIHPEPLDKPKGQGQYLSEVDGMAAHSMEHMFVALKLLDGAYRERERAEAVIQGQKIIEAAQRRLEENRKNKEKTN